MSPVKLHSGFDSLIIGFKFLSVLAFVIIFLHWSITSILFFESGPISSSVTYRFGDDGHGNYEFPAITICLDSFKWIGMSPNGMKNNCYSAIKDTAFVDDSLLYHLMYCTYDKHKADKQKSTVIDGKLKYFLSKLKKKF